MAAQKFNTVLFNVAGGAIFLFIGGYIVASHFHVETIPPCATQYGAGQQYALDKGGQALSPVELQGRAGFREWGLLANASVEKTSGKPWSNSLVVKLAATNNAAKVDENGVGFVWPVLSLRKAQSVCLSYDVFFSNDVDMKSAGHLPGLLAEPIGESPDDPTGFIVRTAWSSLGKAAVEVRAPKSGNDRVAPPKGVEWPRGRWVRVNQEVEINAPGKKSGAVKVWIDGVLGVEAKGLKMRASPQVVFTGVTGDTGYEERPGKAAAVKFSPFVVQWR
ncbi:MAG: polysaccharide lyase [Hyphomicrobium sp.]